MRSYGYAYYCEAHDLYFATAQETDAHDRAIHQGIADDSWYGVPVSFTDSMVWFMALVIDSELDLSAGEEEDSEEEFTQRVFAAAK